MTQAQTMVREYRGKGRHGSYRKDAERLAKDGWTVVSAVDVKQRIGCMRFFLFLGFFALIFPPHPILQVTYSKAAAPATPPSSGF